MLERGNAFSSASIGSASSDLFYDISSRLVMSFLVMRLLDSQHIYQKAIHTQGRTAKLKRGERLKGGGGGRKLRKINSFCESLIKVSEKVRGGGAKERRPHLFNCDHTFRLMKFTYSRVKFKMRCLKKHRILNWFLPRLNDFLGPISYTDRVQ